MSIRKNILVLGVGNLLCRDEGLGVRVIEELHDGYAFSDNVTLLDGGTMGMLLMGPIMDADEVVVADAVLGEGQPGSIYRLNAEDLPLRIPPGSPRTRPDLLDTLTYCRILDSLPRTVIVGMEPADICTVSADLTPVVQRRLPDLVRLVLQEVERAGGTWAPLPAAATGSETA